MMMNDVLAVDASDVTDVHAVLEVVVYDENPDKKVDFLGKVAIPLLRVRVHHSVSVISVTGWRMYRRLYVHYTTNSQP